MKVLFYDWPAFTNEVIIRFFKQKHIRVDTFSYYPLESLEKDEKFVFQMCKKIKDADYDFVFSINYIPVVAIACHMENIPYVSWSYDNPLNIAHIEDTLYFPTNYVFLFDKKQAEGYISQGFSQIYHLPLAIDTNFYDQMKPDKNIQKRYQSQISFVGQIYASTYPSLLAPLGEFERKYLDTLINLQTDLYGAFIIDEYLNDDILKKINTCYRNHPNSKNFQITKKKLSYSMSTYVTFKERVAILTLLSRKFQVSLYSGDKHPLLKDTIQCGKIDYSSQMPYVFKCSDINLNITLKCLQSGIPLRALDIMGCGGFLLSNYQEELLDYFVPDKEFVYYEDFQDAYAKADFYLKNDTLRKKIAQSGYEKIKNNFTYEQRFQTIASLCPFMNQ